MQPFYMDDHGAVRFRPNAIVRYIFDHPQSMIYRNDPCNGKIDLNKIAMMDFSEADRQQFAQLIGYSLDGYHELHYVSDESALAATNAAQREGFLSASGCRDQGCGIHLRDDKRQDS
jgi:hypothetical protein